MDSIDRLAHDPRPENTIAYGSESLRRMRVWKYRLFYEISDATVTITSSTSATWPDASP